MTTLWNLLSARQMRKTQNAIRWMALWAGTALMFYGGITFRLVHSIIGCAWVMFWWAVQCFWKEKGRAEN